MYVEFFGIARDRAGVAELDVNAVTLGDALDALVTRLPRLSELMSNGRLHRAVVANLNGDRFVSDPSTPLADDDRLLILSADAGG